MSARRTTRSAFLQIHLCVLLWGFTAILGKLITLPALPLVWWRMLIVVGGAALVPARVARPARDAARDCAGAYAGIGVLVALHWLTFYGAIKLSNASVGATCIALATVFVALVEPCSTRTRFSKRELLLGIAVLPGVALVVGGVPAGMRAGIAVGALSALLVAMFGSLNKRLVEHADPLTVTALELGAGTIALTLLAPLMPLMSRRSPARSLAMPSRCRADAIWLLLALALACTLLPVRAVAGRAAAHERVRAQLAVNLEPVYAIVLAILLLGEQRELTPAVLRRRGDHPRRGVRPSAAGGTRKPLAASRGRWRHRESKRRGRLSASGPGCLAALHRACTSSTTACTEPPFSITPDPRFVFLSERHRDALAHLLFGIGQGGGGGFVQLTGEVGTGKTTLCRLLLEQLPENTRVALVLNPRLIADRTARNDLRGTAPRHRRHARGSIKALVDALNAYLLDAYAQGPARGADHRRGAEPVGRCAGTGAPADQPGNRHPEAAADHPARPAGAARDAGAAANCASSRSASPRATT